MKGLEVRDTPMGFKAIRFHYTAFPEKDPDHPDPQIGERATAWLQSVRALYPDPNAWAREMEINFFAGAGTRVFPEFRHDTHCVVLSVNRRKLLYRGWDFGWHSPVCLVGQIDMKNRLVILKEIIGREESTYDFASRVVKKCGEWFPTHGPGWEDFCDPAGQQVKSISSEKSERRDVDVLSNLGINASYDPSWSRKDGRTLIHRLLTIRTDQTPGLYVDSEGCATTVQAFLGRYIYPETKDGRIHEDPDDQTHPWADVMAALRYLVTGLHGRLGLVRVAFQLPSLSPSHETIHGYGTLRR